MGYQPLSLRLILATTGPPPGILDAGHNISPRLRKQLVLELEVGVVLAKLLKQLPCGVVSGEPAPLDQHAPLAPTKLGTQHCLRLRQDATISHWRQRGRSSRRIATMWFEQPDMEDVVDAGALRKL